MADVDNELEEQFADLINRYETVIRYSNGSSVRRQYEADGVYDELVDFGQTYPQFANKVPERKSVPVLVKIGLGNDDDDEYVLVSFVRRQLCQWCVIL